MNTDARAATCSLPTPARRRLVILIVEDDRTSRFVLRRMVEASGEHEIHEAENGLRAWEKLVAGLRPDLCFVDLNMPQMNGIEWLRRVRAEPQLGPLRVCFCSAVRDRNTIVQAAALKPDDYILKPYSREVIQTQIQRVLGVPSLNDSLEPASAVCSRLGIDPETYRLRLNAVLDEIRQLTVRLPMTMMQFDFGGAMGLLERGKASSGQLGVKRIVRLIESFIRCFESSGALQWGTGTKAEVALRFQQCLAGSADTLMQTLQGLREEVQVIEGFLAPKAAAGGTGGAGQPGDDLWAKDGAEIAALNRTLSEVFQRGKLASASRTSRSKSLSVPIKASIVGADAAETLGAVTKKTSFSLTILDVETGKAVDECRKVADLVKLLSFPLDEGTRWMPDRAILLLETELAARNQQGVMLLQASIGADLEAFLTRQEGIIRENLNHLYRQAGSLGEASEEQVQSILDDVRERVEPALNGKLTNEVVYTALHLGNLAECRDDTRWASPSSLLFHAASLQRRAWADPAFDRAFKFSTFDRQSFLEAMDVFEDGFAQAPTVEAAEEGVQQLEAIRTSPVSEFEKCRLIWAMVKGS